MGMLADLIYSHSNDDTKKTANMSSEQLRSYVASGVADMRPDHDLDHVLSRVKGLETDAVHTQAAISKAQEMSRGPPSQGPNFPTVDIAFADDGDHQGNVNGSSQAH
ncbi:hypothetical protein ACOMHN_058764 [Nucella lapillus]